MSAPEPRPEIVERLASHGGIRRIHVTPFCDAGGEVIGWQNVVVCMDGTRFGLSPEEERSIDAHHDYLRATKDAWPASPA